MSYQEKAPNGREYASASLSGDFPAKIHRYPAWLSATITSLLLATACLSHSLANAQVRDVPSVPVQPPPVIALPPVPVQPPPVIALPPVSIQPSLVTAGPAGGGNPPLGRPAAVYVTVTCAFAQDGSNDCQRGVAEATEAITDSMAEEAAADVSKRILKVHFTALLDKAEQLKCLTDMEQSAVHIMELRLNQQFKALRPFPQQMPMPMAEAMAIIKQDETALNEINREARAEADSGQNWSHQWSISTHTYESNVYNQAESWHMSQGLRHEYECAGAGNKPGCSWDGGKNQNLYSK